MGFITRIIHTIFGEFRSNAIQERICAIFQAQNFLTLFFLWTPHLNPLSYISFVSSE